MTITTGETMKTVLVAITFPEDDYSDYYHCWDAGNLAEILHGIDDGSVEAILQVSLPESSKSKPSAPPRKFARHGTVGIKPQIATYDYEGRVNDIRWGDDSGEWEYLVCSENMPFSGCTNKWFRESELLERADTAAIRALLNPKEYASGVVNDR